MKIANANGIELAWEGFGNADCEAILLIAGLGTQMIRWTSGFCDRLVALGYYVIRFDNRDSGCSTHFSAHSRPDLTAQASAQEAGSSPRLSYTLYDMAADAIGLLDSLAIERAHVVGRSMGGMIAQIMASEHSARVRSLTSIMSSTGNPALPQASPDLIAMMMQPMPDPRLNLSGFLTRSSAFARHLTGEGFPFDEKAHRALVRQEVSRAYDPTGIRRQIAAIVAGGDRRWQLSAIDKPTLIIHGSDDPLLLPAAGRDTATSIRNADLWMIDGMGHDLPAGLGERIANKIHDVARRALP